MYFTPRHFDDETGADPISYQDLKAGEHFTVDDISTKSLYESSLHNFNIEQLPSTADKLYVMDLSKNLEMCKDKAEVFWI